MPALYSDTHPKIEQMQIEIIRRMPSWKKLSVVNGLNETVKTLAIAGIRQRHPDATPEQIHRQLAELMLGKELAQKVYPGTRRQDGVAMPDEATHITLRVTQALAGLGIPYAVGGSLASSLHGVMRSTLDVDIVADMQFECALKDSA